MKSYICCLVTFFVAMFSVSSWTASAQQQPEKMDLNQMAEQEADKLQKLLDLEDWQVFYVDSTLKHDLPAMMEEYENLRSAKVSNTSLYQDVQDKWMDRIDASYRKIFNDTQWAAYLKSGAAKAQKLRAKRKAKAEEESVKRK